MEKNKIIPQMFDVRPVGKTGNLDWEKINKIEKIAKIEKLVQKERTLYSMADVRSPKAVEDEQIYDEVTPIEISIKSTPQIKIKESFLDYPPISQPSAEQEFIESVITGQETEESEILKRPVLEIAGSFAENIINNAKNSLSFAGSAAAVAFLIWSAAFLVQNFNNRFEILGKGQKGIANIASAVENVKAENFEASAIDFDEAYKNFSDASEELDKMGEFLVEATKYVPYLSKISSGKNAAEAGKHAALAGKSLSSTAEILFSLKNSIKNKSAEAISFLDIFVATENNLKNVKAELEKTGEYLKNIKIDDLPEDKREEFALLKNKLPAIAETTRQFLGNEHIFVDLLGGNGPRKYLFLFQNNQEMRATGGFIGSYALLDISNGRVRKFFIDGIFNPDGQLKKKIIPPMPIQKISAAWSLHDSNWFPDFPASAEKAISFYELTGGPTVDGVITLTPTIMQKFLELTGPIEMEDYDTTLTADNFIEQTQYEVEIDYDKEENRPKKILSDMAPILFDRLFNASDWEVISKAIKILNDGLSEKQVLLYSRNYDLEKIISAQGWSGEVLKSNKDYISVINSNINGYKTDGVVEEIIEHSAEIQSNGTIVDTVAITRKHNGGASQFDWWNRVNANYMRIYVPKGSKLLEVSGQTREFNLPPLDYESLQFKHDPQVQMEEDNMVIDATTGTRIYEDAEKTVFANWVYVSPKEEVTIKYKYMLPFRIIMDEKTKPADSYSLLAQKQSGSIGSKFSSNIIFPENYKIIWKYPDEISSEGNSMKYETDLKTDKFVGVAFVRK